ncbi:unnamed protein product [Effrenium voratum]|nr:unnamed protein product [Effrenium voratum]
MHRSSDGEEPLDVQAAIVAGRTLVVQGSKSNGNMMTSFQRSFRLPWDPDKDHVSVTYSAQDGSLLVDVPRGASSSASDAADSDSGAAAALPGEFLEPLSILAGPQMTLSFSDMDAKLAPRRRPLRGLPIVMGLRPTVRDPFEQLWNGLLADASGMHDVAVPEADPDRKHSMHSKSQPVVVQPKKSAAPFWRFTTGPESRARYLDIVSPQGVEMGKIRGSYVEFFNKGEGQESPKRLELPISVREEDCRQTHMGSQEHVLRCATKDSVKSLHIDVIDEL